MLLCLDVGNTHIVGGVFDKDKIIVRFRHHSVTTMSSDQFGLFLKGILHEYNLKAKDIHAVSMASVVRELNYTLRAACIKFLDKEPFTIQPGIKTGLKLKYRNPQELGADRIATAIAVDKHFPSKNKIVVNFGTATCLCAISENHEHMGGLIFPGIRLSHNALVNGTSNLTSIEIEHPSELLGLSTKSCIQAGLFYSQLGAVKEMVAQIKESYFKNKEVITIGTGGMSYLFSEEKILDIIQPDLVLIGLYEAFILNH